MNDDAVATEPTTHVSDLVEEAAMIRLPPGSVEWLQGLGSLLAEPHFIEDVERTADEIRTGAFTHVIWAGMGGSAVGVQALVSVLKDVPSPVALHVLDSTDPDAVDEVLDLVYRDQQKAVSGSHDPSIENVLLIAVALSRTSQEPADHVRWFAKLVRSEGRAVGTHIRIITVTGSYLERIGHEYGIPINPAFPPNMRELPGRMSTPASQAFLLALALLMPADAPGLRQILEGAWKSHDLDGIVHDPRSNRFVRLAAALSAACRDDGLALFLSLPGEWAAFVRFVEMLLEQSLGKQQNGVVVFDRSTLGQSQLTSQWWRSLTVGIGPAESVGQCDFVINAPELASPNCLRRVSAFVEHALGWQVVAAILGHLHCIDVLTEPAVEHYKRKSLVLRAQYALERASTGIPIETCPAVRPGEHILLDPMKRPHRIDGELSIATSLRALHSSSQLRYLDLTINGRLTAIDRALLIRAARNLACDALGVPFKVREAPADYHVSEQAQMDGPNGLVSLRVLGLDVHRASRAAHDGSAVTAAAIATWEAMVDIAGRRCYLLVVHCRPSETGRAAAAFLRATAELLDNEGWWATATSRE